MLLCKFSFPSLAWCMSEHGSPADPRYFAGLPSREGFPQGPWACLRAWNASAGGLWDGGRGIG